MADTECALDYVGIDGLSDTCDDSSGATIVNRICGGFLNVINAQAQSLTTVCDCVPPFNVHIKTDAIADAISGTATNRGVCFDYRQIPC